MHYYQFNIGDYRKDTAHLTPIEHYIYRQLIDWYYLDETPIPKETQMVLRRLCLGNENTENLKNVLSDFFKLTDNGYFHGRINEEITKYHENAEKNRANGKLGGRPKKQQLTENNKPKKTQSVSSGNPTKSENNPNQEPITNNQEPINNINTGEKSPKRKAFTPPTLEEVSSYCRERGNSISPERWHDYYSANGWKVGKNQMKDWKAAIRTWENNDSQKPTDGPRGLSSKVLN